MELCRSPGTGGTRGTLTTPCSATPVLCPHPSPLPNPPWGHRGHICANSPSAPENPTHTHKPPSVYKLFSSFTAATASSKPTGAPKFARALTPGISSLRASELLTRPGTACLVPCHTGSSCKEEFSNPSPSLRSS